MANEETNAPEFREGYDYTLEYKTKKGRQYAVLMVPYGEWKVIADDDFIHIYHGKTKMLGFDVNGFNSMLQAVMNFTEISRQLREKRNNPPAGAPVNQ